MNKLQPDFENAQRTATKLLIRQSINSLKFDVREFKYDKPIMIDSIQHYCVITGAKKKDFTYNGYNGAYVLSLKSGLNIILYDEDDSNKYHQHWGIAHEVGHIYLDHKSDDYIEEIEAHFFAAQLLMPEVAIRYALKLKGRYTSEDIFECFNVSREAALKRIKTLNNKTIKFFDEDKILFKKLLPLVEQKYLHFNIIESKKSEIGPMKGIV